jgi:hypothetical protein
MFSLSPGQLFKDQFEILVDSAFFYSGENSLVIFYHLYNRKDKGKIGNPIFSIWSSEKKLFVYGNSE